MQTTHGEWILSLEEFAVVVARLELSPGPLCVFPDLPAPGPEAEAVIRQFSTMESSLLEINRRALTVLMAPSKVVRFNTTAGNIRVSRSVLAYDAVFDGAWVCMARAGEMLHISIRSQAELRLLVATHLAADRSIEADRVGADLSTHAVLALLACCEQQRRARMISILRHEEPALLFSAEDVAARIQEASIPDFRWPLSFVADLIPLPIDQMAVSQDPVPALAELLREGFLEAVGDGEVPIFDFNEGGRLFADGLSDEASRAALSVTRTAPGGLIVHDVMLFSRNSRTLLCFFMSGEVGFVSTLLAGDLDELLKTALAPPVEVEATPPPSSPPDLPEQTLVMTQDSALRTAWLAIGDKTLHIEADTEFGRIQSNEIIDDSTISRRHARFSIGPEGWTLTDLGSSNGTRVNGAPVTGSVRLNSGDQVRFGNTTFLFQTSG